MKSIKLTSAEILFDGDTGETLVSFYDGAEIEAQPHETAHYYVIAHRCGYGDNIARYCFEHEFCHEFLSERLHGSPSPVLWSLAHGETDLTDGECAEEEISVQTFQRWLRGNERPIVGGVAWDDLKREALQLLDGPTAALGLAA